MKTIMRNSAITILLTASFTLNGMNNADQAFITAAVQALESIKLEVNVLEMNNGIDDATRKSIDDATIKMIMRLYQETHNEQYKALQNLNDKACDLSVNINELGDSIRDLSLATKDLRHAVTSNGQTVDTQEETRNDNNNNNSTPSSTTASISTWLLSMMGYNTN